MSKSLKLIATVFALGITINITSPSQAAAPSNAELHQMILGMMDKLGRLEAENKGLKKQLGVALIKIEGRSFASLSPPEPNVVGAKPGSPIKAVVLNERQMPSSQAEVRVESNYKARTTIGTALKNYIFPGNDAVNISVSGQVNRAILATSDKNQVDIFHVDNDASSTRFRILGDYIFSKDITFGAAVELEVEIASSSDIDQNTPGNGVDTSISDRRFEVMATSKSYGKLWLGQGAMATDGTSEQDLSGTSLAGYSNVKAIASSLRFRTSNDELSTVTVGRVFDNINGLGLSERVRYDTPNYAGFTASFSASRAGPIDAALKYSGKFGGTKLVAAIGYADRDPDKINKVFNADGDAQINGKSEIDYQFNGSASVLFESGFNLAVAGGGIQFVTTDRNEPRFVYSKIGYRFNPFKFGQTAVSADTYVSRNYRVDEDWIAPGFQIAQNIDGWNLETYLGIRQFVNIAIAADAPNFDSISTGMLGARWIF
jgi:hypothetical protein